MKRKVFLSILIILLVSLSELANAQNFEFDYESYPVLNVNFDHLDLELMIHEDGLIEGEAVYDITFRVSGVDTITLDAARMDIRRVFLNDQMAEYKSGDDQLVVFTNESYNRGDKLKLKIGYTTNPGFGIHSKDGEFFQTSMLPKSTRHWLPVKDHPRVQFTTGITLTYPSGFTAVATGRTSEGEIVSVDRERAFFRSDHPVPATGLAFTIGNFEQFQATVGLHQIHLYLSKDAKLRPERNGELLDAAYLAFRNAEQKTGVGYPWRVIHIVVMNDDKWEIKNYGAGVVFAYENAGDLENQIRYGVTAQWAGVMIREEQWNEAESVKHLQGWLMQDNANRRLKASMNGSTYSEFSPEIQQQYNHFLQSDDQSLFNETIQITAPRLFREKRGTYNWRQFATELYSETGQRFFEPPAISLAEDTVENEKMEKVIYFADLEWNDDEGVVEIAITAKNSAVQELVTAEIITYYFEDVQRREISFSGSAETIRMNVNPTIEYMKVQSLEGSRVEFEEEKPFLFWINQVRSDESTKSRLDAARKLRQFSDNPDLQLAMIDRLNAEENVEVQAEIIRTLAAVTAGASGTEQIFLQRLRDNSPPEVQLAITEALGNYPDNEEVIGVLQRTVIRSSEKEVKEAAVHSLARATGPDRFLRVTEQLITREEAIPVIFPLLNHLSEKGMKNQAVDMATTFLGELSSYSVRISALELILTLEDTAAFWEERLPSMLADSDPRIRHVAIDGLNFLPENKKSEFVESRLFEEYDGRIAEKLRSFRPEID
ncbi:MAG: HEAT repeat domain-containing protein [Balneolaceae bacterium]